MDVEEEGLHYYSNKPAENDKRLIYSRANRQSLLQRYCIATIMCRQNSDRQYKKKCGPRMPRPNAFLVALISRYKRAYF